MRIIFRLKSSLERPDVTQIDGNFNFSNCRAFVSVPSLDVTTDDRWHRSKYEKLQTRDKHDDRDRKSNLAFEATLRTF